MNIANGEILGGGVEQCQTGCPKVRGPNLEKHPRTIGADGSVASDECRAAKRQQSTYLRVRFFNRHDIASDDKHSWRARSIASALIDAILAVSGLTLSRQGRVR